MLLFASSLIGGWVENWFVWHRLDSAIARAREAQCQVELAHGRAWVAHRPIGTLNAGYTGPRRLFRTSPVTGMPTHLHVYPA